MIIITFHYRYRKQLIIAAVIILIISIITIYFVTNRPQSKVKKDSTIVKKTSSIKKNSSNEETSVEYKIDIKGEVINPGIYTMKSSSRIIDCIEKAGGLTENANTTVINLSKKITDEMVIIIYSNAEVANFKETKKLEEQVQEKCRQKDENSLKNDACITNDSKNTTSTSLVSINTATIEELSKLSGIGEAKAKQIIEYRTQNGPFKTIEDIKEVPGIGESIFAQIKDYITT